MLSNSILAGNFEYNYDSVCGCWVGFNQECTGNIVSNGYNIIQNNDGISCIVSGGALAVNPGLHPLSSYGGPTLTRELWPGSPAHNAGRPVALGGCVDDLGFAPLTTDQRGAVRPYGGECDLGAVEHGAMMFSDGFDDSTALRWSAVAPGEIIF